jgi:hypothetical protein
MTSTAPDPRYSLAVREFLALLPETDLSTLIRVAGVPVSPGFAAAFAHRDAFARVTSLTPVLRAIEDDVARIFDRVRSEYRGRPGAPLQDINTAQTWATWAATALALGPRALGPRNFAALYGPFAELIPLAEFSEFSESPDA